MNKYAILVGNDINNISSGKSWKNLIDEIKAHFKVKTINNGDKPFPMLYEEIYLNAVRKNEFDEKELKTYIADQVSKIDENEVHKAIRELPIKNIITTNYEYSIEGAQPGTNDGVVKETTYSIFRRYAMDGKNFWHIHGDCNYPNSINLGFEHYCGQLQAMRNYVVSGTNYESEKVVKTSLIRRLTQGNPIDIQSWLDLFFICDIYIFGLALNFVESDLWWLLTYRARIKTSKKHKSPKIDNKITYFVPKKYEESSKDKLDLLKAHDIRVEIIDIEDRREYYLEVLAQLPKL